MFSAEKCKQVYDSPGALWYLGFTFTCWISFKLLRSLWRGLYTCVLASSIGAKVNWKKLGKWAVVTGATDGIGKAYAKALAKEGFNIVLISRTQKKLDFVAAEIEQITSVQTKTVAVDFSKDLTIYDTIQQSIEGLEISILVNNVGILNEYPEYLTKIYAAEKFTDVSTKINITSCTRMTLLMLPMMEKAGKGVILNISSLSALSPLPLASIYSASKAYVKFFSEAVQEEYKNKGIILQCVMPGFVFTNLFNKKLIFVICSAESFVYWAMKTVGVETRTYGYPVHKLQAYIMEILALYAPKSLVIALYHHLAIAMRKRYYKDCGSVDSKAK